MVLGTTLTVFVKRFLSSRVPIFDRLAGGSGRELVNQIQGRDSN